MTEETTIPLENSAFLSAVHGLPKDSDSIDFDKTLIIMVHGFPGDKNAHNELFIDLGSVLTDKGLHTLRFDFQGCGKSSGDQKDFTLARAGEDLQAVLHWAVQKGYEDFIYIAEGLGASLACTNVPRALTALILLWPILDIKRAGEPYFKRLDGQKALEAEVQKLDLTPAYNTLKTPTLILHGVQDKIVPVSQVEIAKKHFKSKRIELTTFHDGTHGLEKINHRKMMFHHITQFIEKYT